MIFFSFLSVLLFRPLLRRRYICSADPLMQTRRTFILDFTLCIVAGLLVSIHNSILLHIPLWALPSLYIGCVMAGFFIGLDSALGQERAVILAAMEEGTNVKLTRRFYPLTRRFALLAVITSFFVSLVLILVFTRDVEWLAQNLATEQSIQEAQLSVIYEIVFIMSVLLVLIVNLIFSYSRNLRLLFNNETRVLEQVSNGDLSAKVPVATRDEFGVIASHTNHMIDGLRHRFELISSLQLAEEVQQNLLPDSSPFLENFDISGTSIYCEQTGGDYFDYFLLPDNKIGLVVADACGHGVGAALLMSSVRAFITSEICHYTDPAQLLSAINSHITRDCSRTSRFTSMFFLEIDHENTFLRWVRAGHEPPLYYSHADGSFSRLNGEGMVLGITSDYVYRESLKEDVKTGDILVIGTDGIREAGNSKGEFFGEARIEEIIVQMEDQSAQAIQDRIVKEVALFRGEQAQEDDITLVVVKVQ